MRDIEKIKNIFDHYGGIMRTAELTKEKIYYADIAFLIEKGYIEKIRTGYYQWIDTENMSEIKTVSHLFPDGIFCMNTALRHYGYSDRTPAEWHIAVDKYSNRSRFNIDYPFTKPYYVEPNLLELGLSNEIVDGNTVKMYDKERIICDCLRYRNKMDKEIFNKAIQSYVGDSQKNIPNLLTYAEKLKCTTHVKNLIGVWL